MASSFTLSWNIGIFFVINSDYLETFVKYFEWWNLMNPVTFSKLIVFEMWLHEWDIWNPIVWNEKETNFLLVCLVFAQVSSHMCTQLIPCLYIYAYIVQLLTCASITAYDAANAQFYFHFLPVIFLWKINQALFPIRFCIKVFYKN